MKEFLKMTLAVICGLFIMGVIALILGIGAIGSLAAIGSSSSQPTLPKSGVLKLDMSKIVIGEQSLEDNPISSLYGETVSTIGIWQAVQAVNAAAKDPSVKYIYLKTDGSTSSLASLQELRTALSNFRQVSGKAVVSYMENPTTGSYYLATVSDKIYLSPHMGATYMMTGISSQTVFLKDLLDKLGVNIQLIRHGKYKSAGETFIRNSPSPENAEQYQAMIDAMWSSVSSEVSQSRGITREAFDGAIDGLSLCLPRDFLDAGLVDELLDREALEEKLAALAVEKNYKSVKMIPFADYVAVKAAPSFAKASSRIAVIYADGEIIDGRSLGTEPAVEGDRYASILEDVRADSTIKAVVLRVNSPGGSVTASEKIRTEVDKLREVKPVVASYGDYAASGGYWISSSCDKIFCDAVTLTGSIGVFGTVPDFSRTLKDVAHVGVASFNSGKHSDMYSMTRPFDAAEYNYMLRSIESIYDRFTTLVSEGRGIAKEEVDRIGQGRVWAGSDALGINLVDEIGTLEDAIRWAAAAADIEVSPATVAEYPAVPTVFETILSSIEGVDEDYSVLARSIRSLKAPAVLARLPFEVVIR